MAAKTSTYYQSGFDDKMLHSFAVPFDPAQCQIYRALADVVEGLADIAHGRIEQVERIAFIE